MSSEPISLLPAGTPLDSYLLPQSTGAAGVTQKITLTQVNSYIGTHNLDSLSNTATARTNLGLRTMAVLNSSIFGGGFLNITLSGSTFNLTNPCPNFIIVNSSSTSGTIVLPPMNVTGASPSSQVNYFLTIASYASSPITLETNLGASSYTIPPGRVFDVFVIDNSSVDGAVWLIEATPIAIPTNQVAYGNSLGDGITSSSNLTFDGNTLTQTTTTGGFEPSQMTTTQRNAQTPTRARIVYDTTLNQYFGWNPGSSSWVILG